MEIANKCNAIGCNSPAVATGLCNKHYLRYQAHGELEPLRLKGHGVRTTHPLYEAWGNLLRTRKKQMCQSWQDDFWQFAADIGEKPKDILRPSIQKKDPEKPLGPGNWYWRVPADPVAAKSKREYMRNWTQRMRDRDPLYWKDWDLKRHYGVSLEWYTTKLKEQNGVCAICKQPETKKIAGSLPALAVDHCHDSLEVRGLLCSNCNRGIGHLKHDIKILEAAIEYLRRKE